MNDNHDDDSDDSLTPVEQRMFLHNEQWKQCGRRVPRAELEPTLHSVWVTFPELTQSLFKVRTIGELGAYCSVTREELDVEEGHVIDVVLVIENQRFEVEGCIRYLQSTGMAIEFMHPGEEVREKIRKLFEPELLATTLAPFLSYTTMEPGSTATLIYSDGDSNRLQIALVCEKILALVLDLAILDTHLVWRKSDSRKTGDFTGEMIHPDSQKKVLNFVKNLPGLTPDFLKEIESILTHGKVS